MFRSTFLVPALVLAVLSGCGQTQPPYMSSRNTPAVTFGTTYSDEAQLRQQADALQGMTQDIVRKSTAKGAMIGALAGCGLIVLSASNAKNCVSGAVVGGAVGALAGHEAGKKDATRRVRLVNPNALVRSIGKASDQLENVSTDLPQLLEAQDQELAKLKREVERGDASSTVYAARSEQIRANRAQLAEALSLSAQQAEEAHRNLQAAQSQGQTGLDWHLSATKEMAREATSARSSISLL